MTSVAPTCTLCGAVLLCLAGVALHWRNAASSGRVARAKSEAAGACAAWRLEGGAPPATGAATVAFRLNSDGGVVAHSRHPAVADGAYTLRGLEYEADDVVRRIMKRTRQAGGGAFDFSLCEDGDRDAAYGGFAVPALDGSGDILAVGRRVRLPPTKKSSLFQGKTTRAS